MEKLFPRAIVAAVLVALTSALAQAAKTAPVRSVDNIPPAPVTGLKALAGEDGVFLTWTLSADDAISFTPFGDTFVQRYGVEGYFVYRESVEVGEEFVAALLPGTSEFSDITAGVGIAYSYEVRPFDIDNESPLVVELGSLEDLDRIITWYGPSTPFVTVVKVVGEVYFDAVLDSLDTAAMDAFETDFISIVSTELGISGDRIRVTEIVTDSFISWTTVDFEILDPPDGVGEPMATEALATLIALIDDFEMNEKFATLAPVLFAADYSTTETIVIPEPLDGEGNVLLGWFTRQGDKIGFDDFFLLADNFGKTADSKDWDRTFDLVPNNAVDLDDFFKFADDFGKTVANATEIQDLLAGS